MEKEDCLLKSDSKTILESPLPMKRKLFRRFKEFNFVIEPKEKISIVGEEQAKKMGKKYCLLESDSITINDYPHKGVSTVLYRIKALKNLGLSKDESSNRRFLLVKLAGMSRANTIYLKKTLLGFMTMHVCTIEPK